MNNIIDIEKLSREMPYTVPDNFFELSRQRILDATVNAKTRKRKATRRITAIVTSITAIAAATIIAVFVAQREMPQDTPTITAAVMDEYVNDMVENISDEELATWAENTDPDMYLASY